MKKIIFQSFIALSLMQTIGASAQLTVKGSAAFVYVGDELLYVDKGVTLNDGGNIYLRRNGQLMQGDKTSNVNSSTGGTVLGTLSAFTMSNATNQYNYTHYGLPVFNAPTGFDVNTTSLGVPSSVTGFQGANLNGNRTNDGLATTSNIRLNRDFIAWYEGNGAYSSWKYPMLSSNDRVVPKGYGLYFKGTAGTDLTDPGETPVNKAGNSAAQRIEFRGVPNDGNISVSVNSNTLYSMGNPYPSSFNINRFMLDNIDVIEGVYYYVEKNKDTHTLTSYNFGYAQYSPNFTNTNAVTPEGTTGQLLMPTQFYTNDKDNNVIVNGSTVSAQNSPVNTPFIGIGKGFWVKTKAGLPSNSVVNFKNTQRSYTTDVQKLLDGSNNIARAAKEQEYANFDEAINLRGIDYTKISKAPAPMVSIVASAANKVDNLALVFSDMAKDSYMELSDVLSKSDDPDFKFYIEGTDNKYRLKMSKFDLSKKTPITIESKTEQPVAFKIDNIVNFKGSDKVYIYDDYTGVYKDIVNENVDITIPAGVTKGRYYITFSKDNSNLVDQNVMNNAFVVLQNNKDKALTINNPEGFDVVSTEVFDIQGKLILSKKNLGTGPEFRFSTSNFADGIYIVKIGTNNGKSVSKKVAVKN